ncbi:uncharacterized protein LOC142558195 [Dermacentor variabilis]|uniref:uncharacterized protein LOC142558195 n=1 Tax=Dermacentor variabilis TaxID=34621 RepID=UPI003F5B23A6
MAVTTPTATLLENGRRSNSTVFLGNRTRLKEDRGGSQRSAEQARRESCGNRKLMKREYAVLTSWEMREATSLSTQRTLQLYSHVAAEREMPFCPRRNLEDLKEHDTAALEERHETSNFEATVPFSPDSARDTSASEECNKFASVMTRTENSSFKGPYIACSFLWCCSVMHRHKFLILKLETAACKQNLQ